MLNVKQPEKIKHFPAQVGVVLLVFPGKYVASDHRRPARRPDHFVFARLGSQVLDLTLRGEIAFTTSLTLQGYVQSFVTSGDYRDFRELARPGSYAFTPFAYTGDNPDFDSRSLRGNLVLRWEYQPGSTLFVVWSQSRSFSPDTATDPEFRPLSGVRRSFTDDGDDIILVKGSYWLGL